jgi:dolichol-phosphate mannosyltransferase
MSLLGESPVQAERRAGVRVLVLLATYNERDCLADLIGRVHDAIPWMDVLVIDDDSPDGTGDLADQLREQYAGMRVLHRRGKLGLGTAILQGMHYAMDGGYDFLVTMDADLSHDPRYLPALIDGMKECDVMIGSRYARGGRTRNWPLARRGMSWAVNAYTRFVLQIPVHDASGGFRCYRVAMLRHVGLDRVQSRGYSFEEEVLYRCYWSGGRLGEVPIIFNDRKKGESKLDIFEAVRSVCRLMSFGVQSALGLE